MSNLDRVKDALEAKGHKITTHPSGYLTSCPDREDRHPSLTFGEDDAGGVWFKDKAERSTTESILSALGLGREVLKGTNGHNGTNGRKPARIEAPKPKPKSEFKPVINWAKPDDIYPYPLPDGTPNFRVKRYNFLDEDGKPDKTFPTEHWDGQTWQTGRGNSINVPYRIQELMNTQPGELIALCEGEKDAKNLATYAGLVTTALAGGASNTTALAALLPYAHERRFVIFQHNDSAGEKWAETAAALLQETALEVKIITPTLGGWHRIEHGDPSDYIKIALADGKTAADITRGFANLIHNAPIWKPSEQDSEQPAADPVYTFQPFGLADLLQRPNKEWLIKDLLGVNDLAMIYGQPGSGKTFVVIDLILSAALGLGFAGKFETARPLKVAYAAGEGIGGLKGRFAAAANHYQAHTNPLLANLSIFLDVPQLFTDTLDTSITQFVKDWQDRQAGPLDLLVIDTLHAGTAGADENSAKDMGIVLQAVKYARDNLGCTVLLVHHSNKTGAYRGSSALHGAMDSMLETKYDSEVGEGTLECFKQKDAEHFRKVPFKLTGESASQSAFVEWGDYINLNDNGKPTAKQRAKQDVINLLKDKPGLNQSQIVDALEVGKNAILAALEELESEGAVLIEVGAKGAKFYQLKMADL